MPKTIWFQRQKRLIIKLRTNKRNRDIKNKSTNQNDRKQSKTKKKKSDFLNLSTYQSKKILVIINKLIRFLRLLY